ncbi:MAG TPA: hypothetical protein VF469_17900 [Kofleriaceae bacterium]
MSEVVEVAGEAKDPEHALCPDGACTGVLGDDGRCKQCGKSAASTEPPPARTCALCQASFAAGTGSVANGKPLCGACTQQVERDFEEQQRSARIAPAITLGLAGAVAGAAVWAGIAIATDFAIGYIAVLVGFLAGYGVRRGVGRARTPLVRWIAIGCAVIGLLLAKFVIVVHVVKTVLAQMNGIDMPYLDPIWFKVFWKTFPETLTAFDALWLVLAVSAAARQVRPVQLQLIR